MEIQYDAMIFLPQHEELPLEEVSVRLQEAIASCKPQRIELNKWEGSVVTGEDVWTAWWDGWPLHFCLSTQAHVVLESQEIAQLHDRKPPFDRVENCTRRIEVWTGEDPNMEHFNDYMIVLGAVQQHFENAILLDGESELIERP